MDAKDSLAKLMEGNARFVSGKILQRDHVSRRKELLAGQHPYATILTCSDSRVCPEHIFDAGLGEIFVARTAGNIADEVVLGSLEYAAEHLKTPLLIVLGHTSCGAVGASCESENAPGNIGVIVRRLQKAVKLGGKDPAKTVGKNIGCVLEDLRERSGILSHLEKEGKLKIAGAIYSLESGEVKLL